MVRVTNLTNELYCAPIPVGGEEGNRDADHPQDPLACGSVAGAALQFRDEKQETVVVRPYPQLQTLSQPAASAQHVSIQPNPTVTVAAPPAHLALGQQPAFTEGAIKVPVAHLKKPVLGGQERMWSEGGSE